MQNNAALKFAPVFSDDKKIDMSIDNGETKIILSTWTDGLGWCTQKTMALDAGLLIELHRLVSAAKVRVAMESASSDAEDNEDTAKILQFPRFA